ncbi:MAG: hypothetical protein AAF560_00230 [Acidobacteriota bacterium]
MSHGSDAHPHPGPKLTAEDWETLKRVDYFHQTGRELLHWWKHTNSKNSYADRFRLLQQYDPQDTNFGFIDTAPICGGTELPVVGTVQQMLYYRPKKPEKVDVEWIKEQVREFMLRYFMRIASFSDPKFIPSVPEKEPPFYLRPLSMGTSSPSEQRGWGYRQKFFKLNKSGYMGKFPTNHQTEIVDVRQIHGLHNDEHEHVYDWVILDVNIFDFTLNFPPFTSGAQLGLPFRAVAQVIISPDFIIDESDPDKLEELNPNNPNPEDKVVGRYGWGYSFIKPSDPDTFLAYGPEGLGPAFMSFHFDVHASGDVRLYNHFTANQPNSFVRVPLNPIEWGFEIADRASFGLTDRLFGPVRKILRDLPFGSSQLEPIFTFVRLANLLSNGRAARELLISRREILKTVMAIHFMDTYSFQLGTLANWRRFPDWTDPEKLPNWVKTGSREEYP